MTTQNSASQTRAIVFDIGGVLLRTVDWSKRHEWERKLNLPPNSLEALVHGTTTNEKYERGELNFEAFWRAVGERLHLPPDQLTQFRADFYAGDELNIELMQRIREWKRERNVRTGIISNAPPSLRMTLTHQLKILDDFDVVTISAEVGVRKPDARIYDLTLNRLGVAPNEAVFVDDLPENVEGAKNVGMQAIQFTDNAPVIAALEKWLARAHA